MNMFGFVLGAVDIALGIFNFIISLKQTEISKAIMSLLIAIFVIVCGVLCIAKSLGI